MATQLFNQESDMQQMVVGTGAAALPFPSVDSEMKNPEKIMLQALTTNTESIFVGKSNVVVGGANGGHELPPGGNIILPVSNHRDYYAVAAAASQKLQVTYLAV
jgi:hypothetical protein